VESSGWRLYNRLVSDTITPMEQQGYKVTLDHYQGPLDLLLDLIEKRKLFINEISLAKIADDYIAYVGSLNSFPIAESAQFILIAATLLLIKSKSLLPTLDLTSEEEASVHDLEYRLKLYKQIRDLSEHVKVRFGKKIIFERTPSRTITPVFSPDESMIVPNFIAAIKNVLQNLPKHEVLPKAVVKKVISLEEMITSLTDRVQRSLRMSFKEFSKSHGGVGKEHKVNVIVSFLAMLELVKQGIVDVTQEKEYDDIHIETQKIGVPRYE
jgi:segregation and condensation protein A